jgi:hypothetical protein
MLGDVGRLQAIRSLPFLLPLSPLDGGNLD